MLPRKLQAQHECEHELEGVGPVIETDSPLCQQIYYAAPSPHYLSIREYVTRTRTSTEHTSFFNESVWRVSRTFLRSFGVRKKSGGVEPGESFSVSGSGAIFMGGLGARLRGAKKGCTGAGGVGVSGIFSTTRTTSTSLSPDLDRDPGLLFSLLESFEPEVFDSPRVLFTGGTGDRGKSSRLPVLLLLSTLTKPVFGRFVGRPDLASDRSFKSDKYSSSLYRTEAIRFLFPSSIRAERRRNQTYPGLRPSSSLDHSLI